MESECFSDYFYTIIVAQYPGISKREFGRPSMDPVMLIKIPFNDDREM